MILDAENPIGAAFDAFGGIVQQIQVRKGQPGTLQRLRIDRKAVVLARDLDLARFEVLHGVVAAAMSEFHLESAGSVSQRNHLVSQADTEDRQAPPKRADHLDHRRYVGRIAGTVREKSPSGRKAITSSAVMS